jgi:hypothetical protein
MAEATNTIDPKNKPVNKDGNAEYAKFWSQTGLEKYDHTIFEGEKLHYKTLAKNASFLRASALVYEMKNGETWEAKIAREGISSEAANKKLGNYGINEIRWFNYNLGSTSVTAYKATNASNDEQKIALLYMMQAYEHSETTFSGFANALGMSAVDPLNALAIGTGGTSVATNQALKISAQQALKATLMEGLKSHLTKRGLKFLGVAAIDGAIGAGTQQHLEQNLETQQAKINGRTFQYKQDYDWGQTAASTAIGAGIGIGFGVAGGAIVDTVKWGKFEWSNGASKANPKPSTPAAPGPVTIAAPNGYTTLMPAENAKVWLHHVLRWDPFQRTKEKVLNMQESMAVSAWRFVPNRYFTRPHIRSLISYVDDALDQSKIIQPILELYKKLVQLRLQMQTAGSTAEKVKINDAIETTIHDFANDATNQKRFSDIENALTPFANEIQAYKPWKTGEGRLGFDATQVNRLKDWVEHLQLLSKTAQNPQDLLALYQGNRQIFTNAGKEKEGITGAMQHYVNLAAGANLRLHARDKTGIDPFNPLSRKIAKTKNFVGHERDIDDGADGILAGKTANRYTNRLENVEHLERDLNEAFYSKEIRTHTISDNTTGPDNVENLAIRITNFYDQHKDEKNQLSTDNVKALAGLIMSVYNSGRIGDLLIAVRRLKHRQGQTGAIATLPPGLVTELPIVSGPTGLDLIAKSPDWKIVMGIINNLAGTPSQAFYHYHERDMERIAELSTRWIHDTRIAPGTNTIGAPGKVYFISRPIAATWRHAIAALTGGHVVERMDPKTGVKSATEPYKLDWNWNNAPAAGTTGTKALWHNITNRNSLVTALFNPVTLPFRAAYGATKMVGAPIFSHTAYGLGVAGLATYGAAWGYEEITGNETEIAKPALKGIVNVADTLVVAPTRLALSGSEMYVNALTGTAAVLSDQKINLPKVELKGTWVDPDNIRLNSDWVDYVIPSTQAQSSHPTAKATATGGGAAVVAKDGSPKAQTNAPADGEIDPKTVRAALRLFGKNVSDLTISAAHVGWTDENKNKLIKLKAQQQEIQPAVAGLGNYAQDIFLKAGNRLDHVLVPHEKNNRKPAETLLTFEQEDKQRQFKTKKELADWYNDIEAFNNDITKNGWGSEKESEEKKNKLEKLAKNEAAFAPDIQFLVKTEQDRYADGKGLQEILLAAQKSSQPVRPVVPQNYQAPEKSPNADGTAADTQPLPATATVTTGTVQPGTGNAKPGTGSGNTKPASGTTPVKASGTTAAPGKSAPVDLRGNWEKFTDAASEADSAYKEAMKVEGSDNITRVVNATGDMVGAAAKGGTNWLGNTFNRLMNKKDGSGRALIRESSAGVLSLFALSSFISPMLDKMGVGNIPIVGTVLKLAALYYVFMAARKGVDSFMPDAPYTEASHVQKVSPGSQSVNIPALLPVGASVDQNGKLTNASPSALDTAGPDAAQLVPNKPIDNIFISPKHGASLSAAQSETNVAYLAADLAAARIASRKREEMQVETVAHDGRGADVIHVAFNKPRGPAYDGNLALDMG